jgi:uncharacterized phage protein gp47/JayE
MTTLAPIISSTGIAAPSYQAIYQSLVASFQSIYGSDIYVAPDSQDGQMLAVFAQAIFDSNQVSVQVFNTLSPYYAQGASLSSQVKLSAINRKIPTNSTAVGDVVGVAGTIILGGIVRDGTGNLWNLPATVTIPISGIVTVTVTAQIIGAVAAQIGDINQVYNPQLGWQSFTNTVAAVAGEPVESDAALRARQMFSSSLPALGILAAIYAAVGNVAGVLRWQIYENATNATDANGLPPHSFCVVVEGGTITDIAGAIYSRKPPGIQTYGSTGVVVTDSVGLTSTINFDLLAYVNVVVVITIQSFPNYTSAIGTEIINQVSNFIQNMSIGEDVFIAQVSAIASLMGTPDSLQFYVTSVTLNGLSLNVFTAFNQAAQCPVGNVSLVVI